MLLSEERSRTTLQASTMGTRKRIAVSVRSCGICTQELPATDYRQQAPSKTDGDVVQLSCKHLFHTFCIRGAPSWSSVPHDGSFGLCAMRVFVWHASCVRHSSSLYLQAGSFDKDAGEQTGSSARSIQCFAQPVFSCIVNCCLHVPARCLISGIILFES